MHGYESIEYYLNEALSINKVDQDILRETINHYIGILNHNSHHLSESVYLGDVTMDLNTIEKIIAYIDYISDESLVNFYSKEIKYYKNQLLDWIEFQKSEIQSFPEY
jgi:hypothetical protein